MNNRNTVLFFVLSMLMLGTYYVVMGRLAPPPPPPAVVQAVQAAQAGVQPAASVPASGGKPANLSGPTFTRELGVLKLTWRTTDGALTQAVWAQDGTAFFNEEVKDKSGEPVSRAFPGIGGATEGVFSGDPVVADVPGGRTVTFSNASGDKLVYRVPEKEHVLDVEWTSSHGSRLALLRKPENEKYVFNLDRVFTLDETSIQAVPWVGMLKDPFLSFVGSKRKELPPAASRIGLDAGVDPDLKPQKTHYFCALWDVAGQPVRDVATGYSVAPGSDGRVTARLYLGPKQKEQLQAFGKPFEKVLDFGFFGLVSKAMFWVLRSLHTFIPNWGWTILVFSILLRLALWPLNTKTTTQMLRMKDLEPHQKVIQAKYEKFGSDMTKKAEMQKELMAFYKKNGHNPMGGCLPMLLQMPVFFALWSMLSAVFELRHSPFMGWIHDLSMKDPLYILPVLMGASMIAQQAMTPATGDPAQRKMMMWMMPAMMVFFFSSTPSGLCLYYLIFNLIGMTQTWWVRRSYKSQPVAI